MIESSGFIGRLTRAFDDTNIPYMIVGSVASSYHGSPRTTQDVDIVVELHRAQIRPLLSVFPDEDYYVSPEAAQDAIRTRGQFNVIDFQSGWKADLIVRKDRAFSETEFGRRRRGIVFGVDAWVASPEDSILAKLEWAAKSGGSERQLRDIGGILMVRAAQLDLAYIDGWADSLGVTDVWRSVRPSS